MKFNIDFPLLLKPQKHSSNGQIEICFLHSCECEFQ